MEAIRLAHPRQVVAAFGHADPIKSVLAYYLGMPLDLFQRLRIDTASVSVLALQDAGCQILGLNQTVSLPAMAFPRDDASRDAAPRN